MLKFISKIAGLALIATALTAVPAQATTCTVGGSGTAGDPYIICDEASFEGMADHKTSHYKLGADIDLSTRSVASFDFDGELDGAGHTINNYTATFSGGAYKGLFTVLGASSNIHDLQMKNVNITVSDNGSPYIGPLGGRLLGTVARVQISGNMTTSSTYTAGLVGLMFSGGNVTDSVSSVNITAVGDVTYNSGITAAMLDTGGGLPSLNRVIYTGQHTGQWSFAGLYVTQGDGECNAYTQSYAIEQTASSAISSLCNSYLSAAELGAATSTTSGFTSYDNDVWTFGSASALPGLRQFPSLPDRPAGIGVRPGAAKLYVSISRGYDGGLTVTGFDVEYRTRSTDWTSAGVSFTSLPNYVISGLSPESSYQVRARSVTAAGASEWYYYEGWASPINIETYFSHSVPKIIAPLKDGRRMIAPLQLRAGGVAIASTYVEGGNSHMVVETFDSEGNILTATEPVSAIADVHNGEHSSLRIVELQSGELGLIWISNDNRDPAANHSIIKFSRTQGRLTWTTPVAVASELTFSETDQCGYASCGYRQLRAQVTAYGGIAVIAQKSRLNSEVVDLVAASSANGDSWLPAITPLASDDQFTSVDLDAGLAGAIATWTYRTSSNTYKVEYSILKQAGTTKWAASKIALENTAPLFTKSVTRSGNIVTMTALGEQPFGKIVGRDLDIAKGKWLSKQTDLLPTVDLPQNFDIASSGNGDLLVVLETYNALNGHKLFYSKLLKGAKVATSPTEVASFSGDMSLGDVGVIASQNGNPVINWTTNDLSLGRTARFSVAVGSTLLTGQQVPKVSWSTSNAWPILKPNGDLAFYSLSSDPDNHQGIEFVSYNVGNTPTLTLQAITGTAKIGKQLTVAAPAIASYTRVLATTYQWYACTTASLEPSEQIPSTCTKIAGATKQKLKIAKAVKGKYLGYAVTSTNTAGTRLSFSRTTLAVQ